MKETKPVVFHYHFNTYWLFSRKLKIFALCKLNSLVSRCQSQGWTSQGKTLRLLCSSVSLLRQYAPCFATFDEIAQIWNEEESSPLWAKLHTRVVRGSFFWMPLSFLLALESSLGPFWWTSFLSTLSGASEKVLSCWKFTP